jgi:PEP-CTERM motif
MIRRNLFALAFATAFLLPILASAENFTWNFAGSGISGSGTLSADTTGTPGLYVITGGTGQVTYTPLSETFNVSFVACATPAATCTQVNTDGLGANLQYDNYLTPANAPGSELDDFGILLQPGPLGANTYMGIWDTPSQEFFSWTAANGYEALSTPFNVTLTPEPASLFLLGSGLVGLALRRRR